MPESNKARFMARCTVTCPVCDRRHEIVSYHPDRARAGKWLAWAKANYHLCDDCEDKRRRWANYGREYKLEPTPQATERKKP